MPYEDEEPPLVEPDPELDAIARRVIGAAIEVHRHLGPGLDEAIYQAAMEIELRRQGIPYQRQVPINVRYKGEPVGKKLLDLIVLNRLVVELKAVEQIGPVHKAQLLTYLKLVDRRLGLLINFNVALLKDGLNRIIRHR